MLKFDRCQALPYSGRVGVDGEEFDKSESQEPHVQSHAGNFDEARAIARAATALLLAISLLCFCRC